MEVYVKILKDGEAVGFLQFKDEESLSESVELFDTMIDHGFIFEKTTQQEYNNFYEGDELSLDDIKTGNYRIENNND